MIIVCTFTIFLLLLIVVYHQPHTSYAWLPLHYIYQQNNKPKKFNNVPISWLPTSLLFVPRDQQQPWFHLLSNRCVKKICDPPHLIRSRSRNKHRPLLIIPWECYFLVISRWDSIHFGLQIWAFSNYVFRLCKYTPTWMFLPLDLHVQCWIEHVTLGLIYVLFRFCTRIFYSGVPAFLTDCPCAVQCHGLTTCLMYVCLLFVNQVWTDSGYVSFI